MLNPVLYTEKVVSDFLKYQLSTYKFADPDLFSQMRELLNLDATRNSPLLKGPFISLSRPFREGASLHQLGLEKVLHPHLSQLSDYPKVYGHQEKAIRAITSGKSTIISTGTGSGKTECFLYPIISKALTLRDEGAPAGISAVIVYPMNALAEDQLLRLRELLAGSGVTFGMYTGSTPEKASDVSGTKLKSGDSRATYRNAVESRRRKGESTAVHPVEERCSREEMREQGGQPRILLTNVKQLELLLTRDKDAELFNNARLDFLVFDEAHTFSGAMGAETAVLIRRLRAFCGKTEKDSVCVATSATIADPIRGVEAGRDFASRFFGVPRHSVELVGEEYADTTSVWSEHPLPTSPKANTTAMLKGALDSLSALEVDEKNTNARSILEDVFQGVFGQTMTSDWSTQLYDLLRERDIPFLLSQRLKLPDSLENIKAELTKMAERPIGEEEVLLWLALGAAARKDKRPLLRPVIHSFIKGVLGGVVTFPESHPKLWLSGEDQSKDENTNPLVPLPILTCTGCGQHYFEHHLDDLIYGKNGDLGGGKLLHPTGRYWESNAEGMRLLLTNRLIKDLEDQDGGYLPESDAPEDAPPRTWKVHFCRHCGVVSSEDKRTCPGCARDNSLLELLAIQTKPELDGQLSTCVSCKKQGTSFFGPYREPTRPVKATTASDVHILAQAMIQHAENQKLLVFADNRQDAAFQAGWMKDRARRFRILKIFYDELKKDNGLLVSDLVDVLDNTMERNKDLSSSLLKEVWDNFPDRSSREHKTWRKKLLRIHLLRELTHSFKDNMGLEPWGRLRISYEGISRNDDFFAFWAPQLGMSQADLELGVIQYLDNLRRSQNSVVDGIIYLFSRTWERTDQEVQLGLLPLFKAPPKAVKVIREDGDKVNNIVQMLPKNGDSPLTNMMKKWSPGLVTASLSTLTPFVDALWQYLTNDAKVLVPVDLKYSGGNIIKGTQGGYQIDVQKLKLTSQKAKYACQTCRKSYSRPSPGMKCPSYRCGGELSLSEESLDDFNTFMLEQDLALLKPEEHSAQVPGREREKVEQQFKNPIGSVNTLVCTPTLEMGVDIGALDAVLMRNVPPLPANYWQRAGRAGRRHRMAVDITYARPASHDQAYFQEPLKMLMGQIYPPSFNLKNSILIQKHIHSAVLTYFYAVQRSSGYEEKERDEVKKVLENCFPQFTGFYVWEPSKQIRQTPYLVESLDTLIKKHLRDLQRYVETIFSQTWPPEDKEMAEPTFIHDALVKTGEELQRQINHLFERVQWATTQLNKLSNKAGIEGFLSDPMDKAIRKRLEQYLDALKGPLLGKIDPQSLSEESLTLSYLAAEGFLPGYGLDTGSVLGDFIGPEGHINDKYTFNFRRNTVLALREFLPGNQLYALGQKYIPRRFKLKEDPPLLFFYDKASQGLTEIGKADSNHFGQLSEDQVPSMELGDVEILHSSRISDEEETRFQLRSEIRGIEQDRHEGGKAFSWSNLNLQYLKNFRFRQVNIGPMKGGEVEIGYPICHICGQSVSPYSSTAELNKFWERHRQYCHAQFTSLALHVDCISHSIRFQGFADLEQAFSTVEALRQGATRVLEMGLEDLQILDLTGNGKVEILLYDPMPGGSGLLDQMLTRWDEIFDKTLDLVDHCSSACQSACVDCLKNFRNAFYHRYLNRHKAIEVLTTLGRTLAEGHEIPPKMPATLGLVRPVNNPELRLERLLLKAGFPQPETQKTIQLNRPLNKTTPDFYYDIPMNEIGAKGVCIYLDGMGKQNHGDSNRAKIDEVLRGALEDLDYFVVSITVSELNDREAMTRYLQRIAKKLARTDVVEKVKLDEVWLVED